MKKWIFIDLVIFLLFSSLALVFAPDVFSLIVVCVMILLIGLSFARGIWLVLGLADAFRDASRYTTSIKDVTSTSKWNTFKQAEVVFHHKFLDNLWNDYKDMVDNELRDGLICSDPEDVINEEVLSLYGWKSVMLQIPGTLTALGLIGTFLGLILGISGIAFSSVDAAISSITLLLSGIETAFYTSIVGVIFSMLFNISYKFSWNSLLREMGMFMTGFHRYIVPDELSQRKQLDRTDMDKILECLERIPKGNEFLFPNAYTDSQSFDGSNENALMSDIFVGLKNGDFLFYIQPRCDLNTREIVGGEALIRWNHSRLGIISPTIFIPTLEKNGYIVKLDCQLWEDVCRTLQNWISKGLRPVPISVNISKMDLLVIDVCSFFMEMVEKYQVPPQYLQMEIAENAYTHSSELAHETESKLRQAGFRVIINGAKGEFDTLSLLTDSRADALKLEYEQLAARVLDDPEAMTDITEQGRKARVKLIASGIETVKQLSTLRKAGFTEGQGFFLYKPIDAQEFETLLMKAADTSAIPDEAHTDLTESMSTAEKTI